MDQFNRSWIADLEKKFFEGSTHRSGIGSNRTSNGSGSDLDCNNLVEVVQTALSGRSPVGIVCSTTAREALDRVDDSLGGVESFIGPELWSFDDVPDEEALVFYDEKALSRYLKLRERLGHRAAWMRLRADVDDELVVKASFRSILYRF